MGRYSFPTLFNEVLQVNISKLREWGYLNPGHWKGGTITWSRNGNQTGSIGISVNMDEESPHMELDYSYNDQPRKYRVRLVSVPSNLGAGEVWYFLCPNTGKRCRILYSVGGWFLHRDAFNGVYYDSQIRSKKMRYYDKMFGPMYQTEKLYNELNKPSFKPYYNGQPTKRHIRINKKLHAASQVSIEDWERAVVGVM